MQIKNRQKFLAIVAIAGLVLLAGDSLVLEPLIKTWKARQARIKDLASSIETGQRILNSRVITENHWNHMQTNTLPADQTLAENVLYKAFDRWAQTSQISISSLKPQWKPTDEDFITLECRADTTGNIESLSRFIYEVEKDPLAIRIETVELVSHDTNGAQLSLGLQVSGLVINPQEQ